MPNHYKRKRAIEAYRAYYIGEKIAGATWKKRQTPNWVPSKITI